MKMVTIRLKDYTISYLAENFSIKSLEERQRKISIEGRRMRRAYDRGEITKAKYFQLRDKIANMSSRVMMAKGRKRLMKIKKRKRK